MSVNLGTFDRLFRAILGAALIVLAIAGVPDILATGAVRWIAGAAGLILLGTAAVRFCPLYAVLGIRTCKL